MVTKVIKDLVGAVMMAVGATVTICAAVAAAVLYAEDLFGGEFTFVQKDKEPKK